jgi:osmoprotectant transport system permease protein
MKRLPSPTRSFPLSFALCCLALWGAGPARADEGPPKVRIGSKQMTESVILGDMLEQLARAAGAEVRHRQGLGSTQVVWKALTKGEIDAYVEYTGTISEEILSGQGVRGEEALRRALAGRGIVMSAPLGFNNTYALGMRRDAAARLGVRRISDLRGRPELRLGFSNEFMDRQDGWPGLRDRYRLPQHDVRGLDHELAYRGLVNGTLDVTDLYSTDAKIRLYDLEVLEDDLAYFPAYHAVLLYRADLQERAPQVVAALRRLEGQISETAMTDMNARVELDDVPEGRVAADFLAQHLGVESEVHVEGTAGLLLRLTGQHLWLVAVSLGAAILIALPLGVVSARRPGLGQVVLGAAGVIQTIPSIALLVFMISIPFLGLGARPAIAALFLYSLLPIVRNTYAGLRGIPGSVRESAEALGLPATARLRLVELPLAAGAILAGIKTAAVINVGTAALGGFIAAGGYGELIFAGIRKGNIATTLEGAVPAALMALAVQGLFELAERAVVPRGLRLRAE